MSNRPGNKSLAEQQEAFKKGLLNQSKVISGIAEARSTTTVKSHAYGTLHQLIVHILHYDRSFAANSYRRKNTH